MLVDCHSKSNPITVTFILSYHGGWMLPGNMQSLTTSLRYKSRTLLSLGGDVLIHVNSNQAS